MTVTTTLSRISYIEDGATTVFPVPFRFLADADLVVERILADGDVQTLDLSTDYTVSGADNPTGGSITRTTAATGATLRVRRATPREQLMAYVVGDDFPAESHERALDRQMLIAQETDAGSADTNARALRVPAGEIASIVPSPASNVGRFLSTAAAGAFVWAVGMGADAALRIDLAQPTGAELVGFSYADPGLPGSVSDRLAQDAVVTDPPFSANRNGAVDTAAAITAAVATGKQVVIPTGTYLVTSNVSINDLHMNGGILKPAAGVTITIHGALRAKYAKCFDTSLGGAVVLDPAAPVDGLPEWWGAIAGGPDCYAAITACLASSIRVQFGAADYYFSNTLKVIRAHQLIRGMGSEWSPTSVGATRLLITSGSLPALQIGPDVEPVDINHFEVQCIIRDLHVARTVVPVIASGCAGIKFQYTLACYVDNVKTNESMNGFEFDGNVYIQLYRCSAVRDSLGSGSGSDYWRGFYANGASSIGAAGGNASVYLNYCRAACDNATLTAGDSSGFYCDFNYTDIFTESFETVSCRVGMNVQGNTSGSIMTNVDLQLKNSTNDAFTQYGIFINNVNAQGCAEITHGYYGPGATATHALLIQNSHGILVTGGQFIMLASTGCTAIGGIGSTNFVLQNNLIEEATAFAVVLSGCSAFKAFPMVKNAERTLGAPAVVLTGSTTRGYVQPVVSGAAGKIPAGVSLATAGDAYIEVNCSCIDPACLVGGSTNKLLSGGSPVTVAGAFNTTCLASGIMA